MNRDKRLNYFINNEQIIIGISPEQEEEALKELDEWRTRQADNYGNKTADYVKYCHRQIQRIEEYIDRNTF